MDWLVKLIRFGFRATKKLNEGLSMALDKVLYHMLLVDTYLSFITFFDDFNKAKEEWRKMCYGALLPGLYYEIISAIKREDLEGYKKIGFDISDEELQILKGLRNNKFHIPENQNQFVNRSDAFKKWLSTNERGLRDNLRKLDYYMMDLFDNYQHVKWQMEPFLESLPKPPSLLQP